MVLTDDSILDFSEEKAPILAKALTDLTDKEKRDILITYISGRLTGSVIPLKVVGVKRGAAKQSRSDFVYRTLEALEREYISDEDADNLFALKNTIGSGDIITNKFGKPCYISPKLLFRHDDHLKEVLGEIGYGEVLDGSTYLFHHEREKLRSASQDSYVQMLNTASVGSRLEFCELHPDKYRIFYSVKSQLNIPQFIYDKEEKRFINYWWGQPNMLLRPFHEDTVGLDMSKHLITRNTENKHTAEVCIEFGCPPKENNGKRKKREWRPFSTHWYNSAALIKEKDAIQGVVGVNLRSVKNMTIPDINSAIIASNPDAIPLDEDNGYDDVSYNQMVNFNPQKVLVQIASNDKKGLGLAKSEDVTINQRLKAAEILYNKMPRTKIAPKTNKDDGGGDSSHVVVTFPEKEGYKDEGKTRLKVGSDEAQAVLDFVTTSFNKEEEAEYVEVD